MIDQLILVHSCIIYSLKEFNIQNYSNRMIFQLILVHIRINLAYKIQYTLTKLEQVNNNKAEGGGGGRTHIPNYKKKQREDALLDQAPYSPNCSILSSVTLSPAISPSNPQLFSTKT